MTIEQTTELLRVLVQLIQAIAAPALLLFILIYFGVPLRKFIENLGEFSVRAGATGLEATAKRQLEAAVLLGAASTVKSSEFQNTMQVPNAEQAREIATVVSQVNQPGLARQLPRTMVLWVDHNPDNNTHERSSLEALGINLSLCKSPEGALEKLQIHPYHVVIFNVEQKADQATATSLLNATRQLGFRAPLILYASAHELALPAEARRQGFWGSTANPQELFSLVVAAIQTVTTAQNPAIA